MTISAKRQKTTREQRKQKALDGREPLELFVIPNSDTRIWCNDIAPRGTIQNIYEFYRQIGKKYNLDYKKTKTTLHHEGRNILTAWTTLDDLVEVANSKRKQYHDSLKHNVGWSADKLTKLCYKVAKELNIKLEKEIV